MDSFKCKGIVLKVLPVGDMDKVLTIFFKDYGKLSVWAKNCRTAKSKIAMGTNLFCYCDFVITTGGKNLFLNQVDLIESFFSLTNNLDKLSYASYFLEILEKNSPENQPSNDSMFLLLRTLLKLLKDDINCKLISCIYEIKFMQIFGCLQDMTCCIECGKHLDGDTYFYRYGIICNNCNLINKSNVLVKSSSLYTIQFILSSKIENLFSFNISNEILLNLHIVTRNLINNNLEKRMKSYEFIELLEENY